MSARQRDQNGYVRVKGNPISKVGVFQYLGSSISEECEPDRIYNVFRPESSLNNPETIESFKNIPWIDDHEMLGRAEEGLTPAEEKGIHGVTGEEVYFDYPYLRANLNIFSSHLGDIIEDGKNELSPGYRCDYKRQRGTFEGESYDFVQMGILGNHLATVNEGRTGPDVAVMDHKFTLDSKDLVMSKKETDDKTNDKSTAQDATAQDEMTISEMSAAMQEMMPMMKMMMGMMKGGMGDNMEYDGSNEEMMEDAKEEEAMDADKDEKDNKDEKYDKKGEGMDTAAIAKIVTDAVKPLQDEIKTLKSTAMDSKSVIGEINKRDELVRQVTPFTGAFDASDKTLKEVQAYAVKKLGLACDEGLEAGVLAGYLHNRQPVQSFPVYHAMDGAEAGNPIDSYLEGSK